MRGVWAVLAAGVLAGAVQADEVPLPQGAVVSARLTQPTDRYDHAVFGETPESGALELTVNTCIGCTRQHLTTLTVTLPESRVFEDVQARVGDLDGDGRAEVMVVETDLALGASLAIYDAGGKRAATAYIGQTHRWLAPAGVGDFDGDGGLEIAYVDRPHLARELVFLRYDDGTLTEIARAPGFTNHHIGDQVVSGGTRHCAGQDSLIVASGDWSRVRSVRLDGATLVVTDLGPLTNPQDLLGAMRCP